MCGICGTVLRTSGDTAYLVRSMSEALLHRGPDGEGWYRNSHVTLAMRRLAIIDRQSSHQPILNADGSVAVMYNGEIYNYKDIRSSLERRGIVFRTNGDGESILHLYLEHGVEFVSYLIGMFAIVIWDDRSKKIHLYRDRIGEKPIYYKMSQSSFVFSSETRSLLAGGVGFSLDLSAVAAYFHYQYVVEPNTLIAGISKIPPGCHGTLDALKWEFSIKQYWSTENILRSSDLDPDRIGAAFTEVMHSMCVSDTPIGVALSSGIDSSAIASMASRIRGDRVHAFSVGFRGSAESDERSLARQHAEQMGMQFNEIEIDDSEVVDGFPALIASMDEPVADLTAYAYHSIMERSRRMGVPVLLMGHGADELFWGYDWVTEVLYKLATSDGNQRLNSKNTHAIGASFSEYGKCKYGSMRPNLLFNHHPDYQEGGRFCREFLYPRLGPLKYYAEDFDYQDQSGSNIPLSITKLLIRNYLSANGINQIDRLSMASSVEVRLPFVDIRIIELVLGMRSIVDDSGFGQKRWLRDALHGLMPDHLLLRRKRPFEPPYWRWRSKVVAQYGHLLDEGYLVRNGILPRDVIDTLRRDNCHSSVVVSVAYKALCLEMWCQILSAPKRFACESR